MMAMAPPTPSVTDGSFSHSTARMPPLLQNQLERIHVFLSLLLISDQF